VSDRFDEEAERWWSHVDREGVIDEDGEMLDDLLRRIAFEQWSAGYRAGRADAGQACDRYGATLASGVDIATECADLARGGCGREALAQEREAGRREGAERMRERAAEKCRDLYDDPRDREEWFTAEQCALAIEALPTGDESEAAIMRELGDE
jgi:hypothetical protein